MSRPDYRKFLLITCAIIASSMFAWTHQSNSGAASPRSRAVLTRRAHALCSRAVLTCRGRSSALTRCADALCSRAVLTCCGRSSAVLTCRGRSSALTRSAVVDPPLEQRAATTTRNGWRCRRPSTPPPSPRVACGAAAALCDDTRRRDARSPSTSRARLGRRWGLSTSRAQRSPRPRLHRPPSPSRLLWMRVDTHNLDQEPLKCK
jgi:hypothetical protein